jgi:hypothetical protein
MTNETNRDLRPSCPSCGKDVDPEWRFCGACAAELGGATAHDDEPTPGADALQRGSQLPDATAEVLPLPIAPIAAVASEEAARPRPPAPEQETVADAAPGRTRPKKRTWELVAAGLVVAGLLATGLIVHLGTRSALADNRARLASTTRDFDATKAKLSSTINDLNGTRSRLTTTQTDLSTRTRQRDKFHAELDAANVELAGVNSTLDDAQNRVNLQANQIEALKSCLLGVSDALGYAAYEEYASAVAALEAVSVSCDTANKAF